MAVHIFPEWHMQYITDFEIDLLTNVVENRSRLSFAVQTVDFPTDSWVVGIEYRPMPLREFRIVRSFWLNVRGRTHQVRIWPLDHPTPAGTLRGSPTVNHPHGEGWPSLVIRNETANSSLVPGDFVGVQLDTGAYQLIGIYNSWTAGLETHNHIYPPLRRFISVGRPVIWNRPYIDTMVLERSEFHTRGNMSEGFTVQLIEVPMR